MNDLKNIVKQYVYILLACSLLILIDL